MGLIQAICMLVNETGSSKHLHSFSVFFLR